jgi:hypothetical protein
MDDVPSSELTSPGGSCDLWLQAEMSEAMEISAHAKTRGKRVIGYPFLSLDGKERKLTYPNQEEKEVGDASVGRPSYHTAGIKALRSLG